MQKYVMRYAVSTNGVVSHYRHEFDATNDEDATKRAHHEWQLTRARHQNHYQYLTFEGLEEFRKLGWNPDKKS